jgi:hypothetical protein
MQCRYNERVRRRLLNLLTGLSLLLCAGSAAAWLLSLPLGEREWTQSIAGGLRVTVMGHGLAIHTARERIASPPISASRALRKIEWNRFPGDIYYYRWPTHSEWSVAVPLGIPLVFGMVLPTFYVLIVVGSRRERTAGRCTRCCYDLRATPARCPECGTEQALGPSR